MKKSKLDALMWEYIPSENIVINGATKFDQENLDEIPFEDIDEFYLSRDDGYNIRISCVSRLNKLVKESRIQQIEKKDFKAGEEVKPGKIKAELFGSYHLEMSPCYDNGSIGNFEKIEYQISCYHVEGKTVEKKATVLKEWILNGSRTGMRFYGNSQFKFHVDETIYGEYGGLKFPESDTQDMIVCGGRFTHILYKDTAFDINYVGTNYGPKWSENFGISYFEKYGRIPNEEEREVIRFYLGFFMGKHLMYVGNSSYDDLGNQIGFVMENPRTFGFEIESICRSAETPPIGYQNVSMQNYINTIEKYIGSFEELYYKLDFSSLLTSYWYARNIAKPMDLPILAGALEHLKHEWYKAVEDNPETVLMDKKEFLRLIAPIKELIAEQFQATGYADRMKKSIENINRMSVNEQLTYFFEKIGIEIGESENDALKARNLSAHGNVKSEDYRKQYKQSRVYECIICRVLLKLIGYDGDYIDYGTIGYPEKNINIPSGEEG